MAIRLRKEKEVSESFLSYLSLTGDFEDWEKNKEAFQHMNVSLGINHTQNVKTHRLQGDNPIVMWRAFLTTPNICELADFAILLLSMSVNQAGLEHSFSDLKIKQTHLRNRLKLPKLEKMAKVSRATSNLPLSDSHTLFRLVQIFVCPRKQQDSLTSVQNRKTMRMIQWESFLLCPDMLTCWKTMAVQARARTSYRNDHQGQ